MFHVRLASCTLVRVVVTVVEAENALRPCSNVFAWGEYYVGPKGFVSASACIVFPAMCVNLTMPS